MKRVKKWATIGACVALCTASFTMAACGDVANTKLKDISISYGETFNVKELLGESDTIENARLTDSEGNRMIIDGDEIYLYQLGEYRLQLKNGYYAITVADTTAPKALASIISKGVGEKAKIKLTVYDNMDKTVAGTVCKLFYGDSEITLSDDLTFTPEKTGVYTLKVATVDVAGNKGDYSFDFTVGINTDKVVAAGEKVTLSDTLFDGVVSDKTAYDFSYKVTQNKVSREVVVEGNSFVVDNISSYNVTAVATEKANAENKIIVPYTYHTANVDIVDFSGEQSAPTASLVIPSEGIYCGVEQNEANGRNEMKFGHTGNSVDSRCYITIGGLEPNATYEYLSFDLTIKAEDGISLAMFPDQSAAKRTEYFAITKPGTRRVAIKNQTTDSNGILTLFTYLYRKLDVTVSNVQLYKTADFSVYTQLNGNDFVITPGKCLMDAEITDDEIVTYWFSEPGNDRPGFIVRGLTPGKTYDVSFDLETNMNGKGKINTVFYKGNNVSGDQHYGYLTENENETKRSFVIPRLVADENGEIKYVGLYVSGGKTDEALTLKWSNLVVAETNTATTVYGSGENATSVEFEQLLKNDAERLDNVNIYAKDGKLHAVTGKEGMGNTSGKKPQLVIKNLAVGETYNVTVKLTVAGFSPFVVPYKYQNNTKQYYKVIEESETYEYTFIADADDNGEILAGAFYAGGFVKLTVDDVTATRFAGKYGNMYVSAKPAESDKVSISINSQNQLAITTLDGNNGGFGTNAAEDKTAYLNVTGLTANTAYSLDMTFTIAPTDSTSTMATIVFYKDRTKGKSGGFFKNIETNGNLNSQFTYDGAEYLTKKVRLTGTTDKNGKLSFNGLYVGSNTLFIVTDITITAL